MSKIPIVPCAGGIHGPLSADDRHRQLIAAVDGLTDVVLSISVILTSYVVPRLSAKDSEILKEELEKVLNHGQ